MPTYRYVAQPCNCHLERVCSINDMEQWELAGPTCEHGVSWVRDWTMRRSPAFHAGWYEHVGEDPIYCDSMQQLKSAARENQNYSVYAEDMGSLFKAKENRWV